MLHWPHVASSFMFIANAVNFDSLAFDEDLIAQELI